MNLRNNYVIQISKPNAIQKLIPSALSYSGKYRGMEPIEYEDSPCIGITPDSITKETCHGNPFYYRTLFRFCRHFQQNSVNSYPYLSDTESIGKISRGANVKTLTECTENALMTMGISRETDEIRAVDELFHLIHRDDTELVLFYCSSRYDLPRLAVALNKRFPGKMIGCTTAGELSQFGFTEHSITGTCLSAKAIHSHCRLLSPLNSFDAQQAERYVKHLHSENIQPSHSFGLLLIDGLSCMEEQVTGMLYPQLHGMPLVGGSAGDDLKFQRTHIFADGQFHSNAAVVCLIESQVPFRTFRIQHFKPSSHKLVITEADPSKRRVIEIDGEPAAEAYANRLGLRVEQLGPAVFSEHPVIISIGGEHYIRAIQKCESDGSLTFFCAIDNGLVFSLAEGRDLDKNLQSSLEQLNRELGHVNLILGFDCILRRLECQSKGLIESVEQILKQFPFLGFSTFGEQYNSLHVNQTLTGVALGG
jgi:hypothetical protein